MNKEMLIEDLVRDIPDSVGYMMRKGIKCIACGEPVWGTVESASKEKGFTDAEIENIVKELTVLEIEAKKEHAAH